MKRILHSLILLCCVMSATSSNAQNQAYWREGFEGGTISTVNNVTGTGPNNYYGAGVNSTGSWYMHNSYRTTGTACTTPTVYGPNHIRLLQNGTDTPYIVTPVVDNGIKELHLSRANNAAAPNNTRKLSVFYRTDTVGNESPYTGIGWVRVALIPAGPNYCVDTTIMINQASARRIAIGVSQASNADIDSIWLTSVTALPVTFSNNKAFQKSGGVQVEWTTATEANLDHYVIEKSGNGNNFESKATVVGVGTTSSLSTYSWFDASPSNGANFYRVKAVDKDGKTMYSSIMRVNIGKVASTLIISPNPVVNNQLNIQLNDMTKGVYSLNLYNMTGQKVYSQDIKCEEGSSTVSMKIPASVKGGTYNVQLSNGETRISKTIIIQ
jgi:hypothetical protein